MQANANQLRLFFGVKTNPLHRWANILALATLTLLTVIVAPSPGVMAQHITMGTGSQGGIYIQLGRAICKLVEQHHPGLQCKAQQTGGSTENLALLKRGQVNFGIVQSDVHFNAYTGQDVFKRIGKLSDLRSVFSAHRESLAILSRKGSGITALNDLLGKRLNLGGVATGSNTTMRLVLKANGWSDKDFASVEKLSADEQVGALCKKEIDATVYMAGHPNVLTKNMLKGCKAQLIPVTGNRVHHALAKLPYYVRSIIPRDAYREVTQDIPTIGLAATLVTTADTDPLLVGKLTEAVFENFPLLRSKHKAFLTLQRLQMAKTGLTAPHHRGAEAYFKKVGYLQ